MINRFSKLSIGVAILACSTAASANLINLFETQRETDFAYAGVGGLRGTGVGDIALSGVSGTVSQAYLYWHGPTSSSDSTFNANVMFNGSAISGTNIGFSDDNFWGQDNSQAYRADVTGLVSGDGTYALSGFSPDNSNGASLVVYYDDGDTTNNRDIVTFDGNDANFPNSYDPDGWDVTLPGINYSGGTASLVMGVSDGQDFGIGNDGQFFINGVDIAGLFDGASVPATPGSSVGNGGLWDLVEIDITSFLSLGSNTINLTHSGFQDALSAVHFHVNLPAGAAPPDPGQVPEPGVLLLLASGLLMLKRRK
ncbi:MULTISPECIES: PEP-CTERM sorting domain-containing protein [Aliiglaciecola]|uniref:PEP-CTERM sorting domain-containing protein n=1 Tax=Aliiglaciecola TaxID=1406885 RepID=UPI001C09177A|nr:PEP-CTERM sorting domain-containing protein [Aliiglaciecola lipolytica]MBU2876104.1 PEP-CTERM sorting domain-containing protein [Aliiglaciecola lipolytica]